MPEVWKRNDCGPLSMWHQFPRAVAGQQKRDGTPAAIYGLVRFVKWAWGN